MKFKHLRPIFLGLIVVSSLAVVGKFNKKQYSLSLNNVSVTLSNSRLSFKGALATGNVAGASFGYINTTQGAYPSTSSSQLVDGGAMSHTAPATWDSTTYKGFAYTLHNVNAVSGMTPAFEYTTTSGNCATGTCYKQFADAENSQAAQTIFSSSAPAENHNLYMCYKAVIGSIQAAGDYENYLTYTATAVF